MISKLKKIVKVEFMFWDEKAECMSREEIEELQLRKLQATVKRAFDKVPFYNKKYTECEVFPEDIGGPFIKRNNWKACSKRIYQERPGDMGGSDIKRPQDDGP